MIVGTAIVKNEEAGIVATLESIRPYVDRFVICDTGSTDRTQEVVSRYFGREGLSDSELVSIPFGDFSASRNSALRLSDCGPGFALMFDCDARLEGDPRAFRADLAALGSAGAASLLCRTSPLDPARFHRRCIVRTGVGLDGPGTPEGWHFRFPVHEILAATKEEVAPLIPSVQMYYEISDGDRRRDRWQNFDLPKIREYLRAHPGEPRMQFYLAQTYECLGGSSSKGMLAHAIGAYRARVDNLGGFGEERFEAQKRIGDCLLQLGREEEALGAYVAAFGLAPNRAEPLEKIARILLSRGQIHAASYYAFAAASIPYPEHAAGFVDADLYRSRARDLSAFCEKLLGYPERNE